MAMLFRPLTVRGVTLGNRVVVSPMCQYSARDGVPGDWHRQHYGAMAASGVGQIVIESTGINPEGRISYGCLGLWNDAQETAFTELVRSMKSFGNSKVSIQISHAGRKASTAVLWEGAQPVKENPWTCYAPSAIPYAKGWPVPEALDKTGIDKVKEGFVAATKRAARIGFDTIELHSSNGYLIHEFLSPITNHRTDEYGGSLENRMRLPLEIIAAVRAAWPADKPIGMRISATEWVENCFNLEDSIVYASKAKKLGLDYICVSSGGNVPHAKINYVPGFQVPLAQAIRQRTGLIVRAVGVIAAPEQAEEILKQDQADLIAIGRGFLNDPRWVWHAAKKLGVSFAYAPQYLLCQPAMWNMSDVANPQTPSPLAQNPPKSPA